MSSRLGGRDHEEVLLMLQDRPLDTSSGNMNPALLTRQLLLRGLKARQQAAYGFGRTSSPEDGDTGWCL